MLFRKKEISEVRRLALSVSVLAAVGVALAMPARAEPTALFVLDASGSMWGRVGETTKVEAAREAMGEMLRDLPADVSAGLIAYGHRRKGDCRDIEMLQSPIPGSGPQLAGRLDGLVPRGKTPIADALKLAGEQLAQIEDETAVVLVSDGIETCEGDPCAVAEALHGRDVRLKVHVVGYDVSGDLAAVEQLQCVAEKGGGRYFTADDVGGLKDALATVAQAVAAREPSPEPPAVVTPPEPASTTKRITMTISGPGTVEITPADWVIMPPARWSLVEPETGEKVASTSGEGPLKVEPGTYQILWQQRCCPGEALLPELITVKSKETARVPIDTGMQLMLPQGLEPPRRWKLLDAEGTEVVTAYLGTADPVPTPPGKFRLSFTQTSAHSEVELGEVEISRGQLSKIPIDQGVRFQPPPWIEETKLRLTLYLINDQGQKIRVGAPGLAAVSPGTYQASLSTQSRSAINWGEVVVPEEGFANAGINSGITFLSQDKAPHEVRAVNLDDEETTSINNSWGPMLLPPGRWRIDLRPTSSDSMLTVIEEVEIAPDVLIEVEG